MDGEYIYGWGRLPKPEAKRDKTAVSLHEAYFGMPLKVPETKHLNRAAEATTKGLLLEHLFKDRGFGPSTFDRIIKIIPPKLPFMFMPPTEDFIEKQIQNSPEHKKLFPKEAPAT